MARTHEAISWNRASICFVVLIGLLIYGPRAGAQNTALGGSFAVGVNAQNVNAGTLGNQTTAIGTNALLANLAGANNNTAVGFEALRFNEASSNNTAIGANSLTNTNIGGIGGGQNTAVGSSSMNANTTGENNTAVGTNALLLNTDGDGNNAFGFDALRATQGNNNNAFGGSALAVNSSGNGNTAMGESALRFSTTGDDNVAMGMNSMTANTTGSNNVAVGRDTLNVNTTGTLNTAIGYAANSGTPGSLATGNIGATALGANAIADGFSATAVGIGAQAIGANTSAFGNGARATRANQMAFGTTSNTYTMAGVNSSASTAAQSGPTEFVTADANGNLATDGGATNIIINKNTAGIAGAFALSGIPEILPNGTRYAVAANWGTFGGANAAALGGVARIDGDLFFNAATVLGYAPGVRAGLAYCW